MVTKIEVLDEPTPELMTAGTIHFLTHDSEAEENGLALKQWAILACPECAVPRLVTPRQIAGLVSVICEACCAWFSIDGDSVVPRQPS